MSVAHPHYKLQPAVKGEFLSWWKALHSETAGGSQRADRAALRRADSLAVVACLPAYQRIFRRMAAKHEGDAWAPYQKDRIAALVGLAAHLNAKDEASVPEAMSRRAEGADRNPVSDLRFARLLDSPDLDALFVGCHRHLGGTTGRAQGKAHRGQPETACPPASSRGYCDVRTHVG